MGHADSQKLWVGRGNVISTTVLSTNQGGRTKYYQIIDGNVISTTRNVSTGLSTTIALWGKLPY
jgi:hypothetical protein